MYDMMMMIMVIVITVVDMDYLFDYMRIIWLTLHHYDIDMITDIE